MKVNIFEGSRRIAKLIGVVIILATLYSAIFDSHTVQGTLEYEVATVSAPLSETSRPCGIDDAEKYTNLVSPKGVPIRAMICFRAALFNNSDWLIPYKIEGGNMYGKERYSPEVESYMDKIVASSTIPPEDIKKFDEFLFFKKAWEITKTIGIGGIWLVCFCFSVIVIGWVVRGFLGIPNGSDERASESPNSN
jgi:hypothetical protein